MSDTMNDKITPAQLRELADDKWATQGQMQDALRQAADEIDRLEAEFTKTIGEVAQ